MRPDSFRNLRYLWSTAVLLLIAYSRFILLPNLYFDQDEVWSIWLANNTLAEILGRNPFDSPPGFYIILSAWQWFTGISPFATRIFIILLFMLNNALIFSLAKRLLKLSGSGYYAMLAYSGIGYIVYLSILLRPYAPVMLLFPLLLYLTDHYFESPTIKRAILVAIVIAGMWYINLSTIFAYLIVALYSLFKDWRKILHWIIPGSVAFVLVLPELWAKVSTVLERTSSDLRSSSLPPLPQALYERYINYFGTQWLIWFVIIGIAIVLILINRKAKKSIFTFFLIWAIGGPVLLYITHSRTNFFQFARYGWWIAPAFALLLTYGISVLPRRIQWLCSIGLIVLLFMPQNIADYKEPIPDFEASFAWLNQYYTAGDIVIVDANCQCNRPEVWDYYEQIYFPRGLNIVDEVHDYDHRIWYFRTIDHEDPATIGAIQKTRQAGIFAGHPRFFLQLYIGAPDSQGILFENGLRFHGYEVLDNDSLQPQNAMINMPEGENLILRLWWSIDEPLEQDYSVGIQVWNETWGMYAQDDRTPQPIFLQPNLYDYGDPPGTMSAWESNTLYVEERVIFLPYESRLRRTNFTVFITVYQWWDGVTILTEGTNENDLLPLFDFTVVAW